MTADELRALIPPDWLLVIESMVPAWSVEQLARRLGEEHRAVRHGGRPRDDRLAAGDRCHPSRSRESATPSGLLDVGGACPQCRRSSRRQGWLPPYGDPFRSPDGAPRNLHRIEPIWARE